MGFAISLTQSGVGCFLASLMINLWPQRFSWRVFSRLPVIEHPRSRLDAVELVGQGLAGVLLLHGEDTLEGLLLAAEDLHLLLVGAKLLLKSVDRIIQVVQLPLKVGSVVETNLGLLAIESSGAGAQSHLAEFLRRCRRGLRP